VVLDVFTGTGTPFGAALDAKRRAIGVDVPLWRLFDLS
jgi:hypothetical protein